MFLDVSCALAVPSPILSCHIRSYRIISHLISSHLIISHPLPASPVFSTGVHRSSETSQEFLGSRWLWTFASIDWAQGPHISGGCQQERGCCIHCLLGQREDSPGLGRVGQWRAGQDGSILRGSDVLGGPFPAEDLDTRGFPNGWYGQWTKMGESAWGHWLVDREMLQGQSPYGDPYGRMCTADDRANSPPPISQVAHQTQEEVQHRTHFSRHCGAVPVSLSSPMDRSLLRARSDRWGSPTPERTAKSSSVFGRCEFSDPLGTPSCKQEWCWCFWCGPGCCLWWRFSWCDSERVWGVARSCGSTTRLDVQIDHGRSAKTGRYVVLRPPFAF